MVGNDSQGARSLSGQNSPSIKSLVGLGLIILAIAPGLVNNFLLTLNRSQVTSFDNLFDSRFVGTYGDGAKLYKVTPTDDKHFANQMNIPPDQVDNFNYYIATDAANRPLKLELAEDKMSARAVADRNGQEPVATFKSGEPFHIIQPTDQLETPDKKSAATPVIQVQKSKPLDVEVAESEFEPVPDNWIKQLWNAKFLPRKNVGVFYSITFLIFLSGFWADSLRNYILFKAESLHKLSKKSFINVPLIVIYWFVAVNILDFVQSSDLMILSGLVGAGIKTDNEKLFL